MRNSADTPCWLGSMGLPNNLVASRKGAAFLRAVGASCKILNSHTLTSALKNCSVNTILNFPKFDMIGISCYALNSPLFSKLLRDSYHVCEQGGWVRGLLNKLKLFLDG